MVQLYSAFAYHGPPIAYTVASDLAELLRQDGFNSVQEAVGVNQKWTQDLSKNIILPQETNEIKFERSARNFMGFFSVVSTS